MSYNAQSADPYYILFGCMRWICLLLILLHSTFRSYKFMFIRWMTVIIIWYYIMLHMQHNTNTHRGRRARAHKDVYYLLKYPEIGLPATIWHEILPLPYPVSAIRALRLSHCILEWIEVFQLLVDMTEMSFILITVSCFHHGNLS